MKILVLGHTGMLGSMAIQYFSQLGHQVHFVKARYGNKYFDSYVQDFGGDYIINCIGAIPQRTDNFKINTDLPILLSNIAQCRVIHPGTDCEMDADDYGTSKRLASEYIKLYSKNTKILKTSIVGPENGTAFGLMAWLGAQENQKVKGYTGAIWNGNTTLEWCKQAAELMQNWDLYKAETILEGKPISKFDMLQLFKGFYNVNVEIEPVELGKNKCLQGEVKTKSLQEQLEELKSFLKL
jgi:dTDP-4-dehydrorhamnose reductase